MTAHTDVLIVGGGPAGLVCGILLARNGIRTLVLESHPDFEREYRGEVLMPRFIQAMEQVGLFKPLLAYPHLKLEGFELYIKNRRAAMIRIAEVSPKIPFIFWMSQPVMLNALHNEGKKEPNFDLWFNTRYTDLLVENGQVNGVRAMRDGKEVEIKASVTVGADGRFSAVRKDLKAEMAYEDHDFDILWFTIPKPRDYDNSVRGFFTEKHNYLSLPKYPNHVQCGIFIQAGSYGKLQKEGIALLKKELQSAHPMLREFTEGLRDFSPFVLLSARADRVKEWARDGLVLIGDAAHTCSPAGAIGVSVAVETAIVASDVIAGALKDKDVSRKRLGRIQELREKEVKEIQSIQNGAAAIVGVGSFLAKAAAFAVVMLLAKTRVFVRIQRRLMVARGPLPLGGK